MSAFVKRLAPAQLVMLGAWGFFGASTSQLLPENPWDLVAGKLTDTVIFSEDPACNGEDFSALTALPDVDLASVHIYPEYWSICTTCVRPRETPNLPCVCCYALQGEHRSPRGTSLAPMEACRDMRGQVCRKQTGGLLVGVGFMQGNTYHGMLGASAGTAG